MKTVGIGLLVLLGVALLWGMVWGIRWITAMPTGALEAQEQIQSRDFRIGAYQHFFNLYGAIQALDAALAEQERILVQTPDPKDQQRIRQNIAGITAERARAIYQYNMDARKGYTEGQFRDNSLPYQIDVNFRGGKK